MTDAGPSNDPSRPDAISQRPAPPTTGASIARAPAIIVSILIASIVGLSLWYLAQPQPLLVQGEADATRIDIAARVDGKVGKRPVERGDNLTAGAMLFQIDWAESRSARPSRF